MFWPRSGCRPVPGRPICPVISASEIRQRALSVPCTCCEMPIPQKMMAVFAIAYRRAVSRMVSGAMPHSGATFSGLYSRTVSRSASNPSVWASMNAWSCSPSSMMVCIMPFSSSTSVPGRN